MAIGFNPLPYGLRDVKVTPYLDEAATTLGTPVDLPNSRTLSFTESEEFNQLRGDDRLVASHGSGPNVEWELEAGGISFEAVRVMFGGTITETGSTPNQVKTYRKLVTDTRPYFRIEGQSISDSGGDLHCIIHKCKAEGELTGTMGDGEFFLTGASGVGMPSTVPATLDAVYDWVQNETATAIA